MRSCRPTCAHSLGCFCLQLKGIINAILIKLGARGHSFLDCLAAVAQHIEGRLCNDGHQLAAVAPPDVLGRHINAPNDLRNSIMLLKRYACYH